MINLLTGAGLVLLLLQNQIANGEDRTTGKTVLCLGQLGWRITGFEGLRVIVRILCTAAKQACRYLLYSFVFYPRLDKP